MTYISTEPRSFLFSCLILYSLVSGAASIATTADWETLANRVSGNLHTVVPFAQSCFSTFNGQNVSVNQSECAEIQKNYNDGIVRTNQYAGFYHTYGDGCLSNATNQCILNPDNPYASTAGESCNYGILSSYYIEVTCAADVQAAYTFARDTGTALSIKATGHDYMTRSSLAGSLALWTRNLKDMTFHPTFIPAGQLSTEHSPVQAITLGGGVNGNEAQAFAAANNVTILTASSPTVAINGGWSLNGGHSVLTPVLGMGSDRILELTIVTPDGELRVCNAVQNSDLFWALRGAGGGAFGVVLNVTVKAEPILPLSLAIMNIPTTVDNQAPFLELLINSTEVWARDGWGGPMSASSIVLVNPLMDLEAATASMADASAFVQANNGTVTIRHFDAFYDFYSQYIAPSVQGTGYGNLLDFRVIPKSMHTTAEGRAKLLDYLMAQVQANFTVSLFQTAPSNYNNSGDASGSSVHPAWRNSYWLIGGSIEYAWNATRAEREQAARAIQQHSIDLVALAPDGCAYPNEANPWQQNWESEFWGSNYARLAAIKQKYDPKSLLNCWRCVGFKEQNPAFECMAVFDGLV